MRSVSVRKRALAGGSGGLVAHAFLVLLTSVTLAASVRAEQAAATGSAEAGEALPSAPSSEPVAAVEQPYVHRGFTYRSISAARYNPLGMSTFLRLGYQLPLLGPQENILLQRTYAAMNGIFSVTPAYARGGLRVDIQPLAILALVASYEFVGYFGSFDSLLSFPDVSRDFSDDAQKERGDQNQHYAATGGSVMLEPTLQARLGPVTFVSSTGFVYNHMRLRSADRVYFDLYYDLLAPQRGWIVSNETQLLFGPATGFAAGLRHSIYHALFPDSAVAGDEARARAITPIESLGPLFIYNFFEHERAESYNAPLLFACVAWWLRHPYRTGVETSQAVPNVTVGFTFRGDL